MADFLKIDLDQHNQPATARLRDDVTTITQAYFDKSGVTITRFGIDKKPRSFYLTAEELSYLCGFAGEYDARVMQHTVTIAERKEAAIVEAKALAKSVQFDLPDLNVRAKRDGDQWHVVVRAIGVEHYTTTENLKGTVQDLLNRIRHEVESAECYYNDLSDEWKQIVASYRRVFPLENCHFCNKLIDARDIKVCGPEENQVGVCDECRSHTQLGEPAEITQARKLLQAVLHPADWAVHSLHPGTTANCWSFDNGLEGERHFAMFNNTPAEILAFVQRYAPFGPSDLEAMQIDQAEQGELSSEAINAIQDLTTAIREANENYVDPLTLIVQARKLLEQSAHPEGWTLEAVYPDTTTDCFSFDNGQDGDAHVAFLSKSAAEMLELVSQYITETKREQGESDEMIAGFWARYRFATDTEQAPELSALPE